MGSGQTRFVVALIGALVLIACFACADTPQCRSNPDCLSNTESNRLAKKVKSYGASVESEIQSLDPVKSVEGPIDADKQDQPDKIPDDKIVGGDLQNVATSTETLHREAQRIEETSVLSASAAPPTFTPLALDVLPQKYWQPVFQGCQSVYTDQHCDYSYPTPRLRVADFNELLYARSLEQGRTNLIEPLEGRQAMAQLLNVGVRSRRDAYTRASPANDLSAQNVCAQLKRKSPSHVLF